jgi:MRG-binding protein
MAGLVGGDSDSSALTQESGDEGTTGTGRLGSVATGTDGGTDYAEEDVEMGDPSPGMSMQFKIFCFSLSALSITESY